MTTHRLLLLPGDGIGPEVMAEVKKVIAILNERGPDRFETEEALVGGGCYDAHGAAITEDTMAKGRAAPSGTACPSACARGRACSACARISACSPTSGRRCATRRSRIHRASS